jgi:hypothetical protein
VHAPLAETGVADRQLIRETGRRLATAYLKDRPLKTGRGRREREKDLLRRTK